MRVYFLDNANMSGFVGCQVAADWQTAAYTLTERPMYGSRRLGVDKATLEFMGYTPPTNNITNHILGLKQYSGSNHLGNVLTTFSDKKIPVENNGTIAYYNADVTSSTDYYPFGVTMKGRDFNSSTSRFGFNSMEKIEETETMDFGARLLDGDLGVWLALDPLMAKYPDLSPYCFVANSPLIFVDPDGREIKITCPETGQSLIYTPNMSASDNSSKFVQDAIMGLNYLYKEGVDDNGVNRVSDIVNAVSTLVIMQPMQIGSTRYAPEKSILFFENRVADNYGDGVQSPIIGLAHDIDHAHKSILAYDKAYELNDYNNPKFAEYWGEARMYEDSDEVLIQKYENPAMEYESVIGGLSYEGMKLSTFKRNEYIRPKTVFLVDSIFTIIPAKNPIPELQKMVDNVNQFLESSVNTE